MTFDEKWCRKRLMARWGNRSIHAQDVVFALMKDAYLEGQKSMIEQFKAGRESDDEVEELIDAYWDNRLKGPSGEL